MNTRLNQFLLSEGISQAQFADSINVARAGISHILAGRNKPSYEFIVNTMKAYPALNIEWLLTGQGSMYREGHGQGESEPGGLFNTQSQSQQMTSELAMAQIATRESPITNSPAAIQKIVVFFNDGTYKEFC